jgi:hypothetical protein
MDDREPIRVNRILSKKPGIAGIPADVFITALALDLILYLVLVQMFKLGWEPFLLAIVVVDGTWAVLTIRGVWRFVGLIFKPERYVRANLPYISQLSPNGTSQNRKRKLSSRTK